jgi:hypothetical protein
LEVDFLVRPRQGWAPQRNARHIRKLGTPTHVRNANARHVRKMVAQTQNASTRKTSTQGSTRHVRKLGAPTQRKARPQVGCPNTRPQRKWKARPHVRKLGAPTQCKARPQVGCPKATQGEFARWAPKRKTHPQRKRPHKGELGKKTSWRMDKKKFWLGGRLFNMASPRLGAAMQRKARPQDMCPNTTHGMSVRWARKRKTDLQRKCPHKGALG